MEKKRFVEDIISKMTVEQKLGQCLVLGYVGTMITPAILKRICEYYPAGIRVGFRWRTRNATHDPGCTPPEYAYRLLRTPQGTVKDFVTGLPVPHCTNEEFCVFLNTLKQAALDNDLGLPLHITFDAEGDMSADYYRGGVKYFPSFKGISATGEPELAYKVTNAIAQQLIPIGFSWSHSLVLDTNTNPLNPEIYTRSFGSDPDKVIEYATEAFKGYRDGGMICTGKHFPGRGESTSDAHEGLPVIDISRKELEKHLKPFKALIDAGVPAIMTAHTAYPQIEPEHIPATLSKTILTDILKGELGFKGAITTDAMEMGGIMKMYDYDEACIKALNAGADLLLLRDESAVVDELIPKLVKAVEAGRLPLERIEDAVSRTLSIKYDYGFFGETSNVGIKDPAHASDGIQSPQIRLLARETAQKAITLLRDDQNILPLSPSTRVLLIEQVNILHEQTNTQECHPGILWEYMLKQSENVGQVEVHRSPTDDDIERVKARIDQADVIIATNYFDRRAEKGGELIRDLATNCGKPVIVITNCPFPMTVYPEFKTVVCIYNSSPEAMDETAQYVFGCRE